MTLDEFKQHIESFKPGTEFPYGISRPFSWRGDYSQVAFSFLDKPSTREEILDKIEDALTETFEGYKSGSYNFYGFTEIHFEESYGRYTDGEYCAQQLEKVSGIGDRTIEAMLVKAAFK